MRAAVMNFVEVSKHQVFYACDNIILVSTITKTMLF